MECPLGSGDRVKTILTVRRFAPAVIGTAHTSGVKLARRQARVATLILVAGALVTSALIPESAAADDPLPPLALEGPMPDGADTLSIRALPVIENMSKGDSLPIVPLDDAVIVVRGDKFRAYLDPADVPASHIGDQGLVDLLIIGANGKETWETESSARITTVDGSRSKRQFWTDPS